MKTRLLTCFLATLVVTLPVLGQDLSLNEIYISHDGTDDHEFIELTGTPGTSLDNVLVLVVEGDNTVKGNLDRVWDLTGNVMPADGYFVLGDNAVTTLDYSIGSSNRIENGTNTFYLLLATDPAAVDALLGDNVSNGDGTTSLPGMGTLLDIVGVQDDDFSTDETYDGALTLGPDGSNVPAGIYRSHVNVTDGPNYWGESDFLDFDDVAGTNMPQTPGEANPWASPELHITEVLASGLGYSYVEITNTGLQTHDLGGYSIGGVVDPPASDGLNENQVVWSGDSIIITDGDAGTFLTKWASAPPFPIIGDFPMFIDLYPTVSLWVHGARHVDEVSVQTDGDWFSAWHESLSPYADAIGNNTSPWAVAYAGDGFGSVSSTDGHVGNPGTFASVEAIGSWVDSGGSLQGDPAFPAPMMTGSGPLVDDGPIGVSLLEALPGAPAYIVVGASEINAPFKGGLLVPAPNLIIILPSTPGQLHMSGVWPAGMPSGMAISFQTWVADPSGPAGFTASNGVRATAP